MDAATEADMLGKIYFQRLQGKQWDWIIDQDWYNPSVGKPPIKRRKNSFVFATGGWWVIRTELLKKWDWPTPELKHCGGDSMLGELIRHQKYTLSGFETGVKINADDRGRHSKARPRGESWNRVLLGINGRCEEKDFLHQHFEMSRTTYGYD